LRFLPTILICALTLLEIGTISWVASAQEVQVSPKARKLFEAGVAFLEHKGGPKYEEAYRAFKDAYAESPAPAILGNLALCAMELERDGEAIETYRRYLADANDIPEDERKQIQKDVKLLEVGSGVLQLGGDASGWEVVDERQPTRGSSVRNRYGPFEKSTVKLRVRAGEHRLQLKAPDGTSREVALVVDAGKSQTVALEKKKPDDPGGDKTATPTLPIPYVSRPLTLPAVTLAPALRFRAGRQVLAGSGETAVGLDLGMQAGIIDNLELDVWAVPIEILPQGDFGTATARVTYRYLDEVVELGSSLRAGHVLFPGQERRFLLEPHIMRMLAHADPLVRVDSAFLLPILFGGASVQVGMQIPLEVAVQPVDIFHFGLATGVGIVDFQDAARSSFIPLGVFLGVTASVDGQPLLDIGGRFAFPQFYRPRGLNEMDEKDRIEERHFVGSLTFRFFLFL
jgi:hypothetical protein